MLSVSVDVDGSHERGGYRDFDCSLSLEWSMCCDGFLNVSIE